MNSKIFRFARGIVAIAFCVLSLLPTLNAQNVSCVAAHDFAGTNDGGASIAPLFAATDGFLYGTTSGGGVNLNGTVFQVDISGNFNTLHAFAGGANDGGVPAAGLIQGPASFFYGVTAAGGSNNYGTVFKVSSTGTYQVLHFFNGASDGANPRAALVLGRDGNFYGTTTSGGSNNLGTVFKMTVAGAVTSLYSFTGLGNDGAVPQTALIQGVDSNFYGTTYYGGSSNAGVVFKLTTAGTLTTLYSFTGGADGRYVAAPLIQGSDNNFYGTTYYGGVNASGNIFQLTTNGTLNNLYSFTGVNDGARPKAALVQVGTNFYGTTFAGGATGGGTIFKFNAGGFTNLYSFTGGTDGYRPDSALVVGSDGNLYGTTSQGNPQNHGGAAFKMIVHPSFFTGESALANGVYSLTFPDNTLFGYYSYQDFPYLYHFDLGFLYFFDANDGASGAYFYDYISHHYWYTTPHLFPYMYDFNLNAWLYYYIDNTNPGHYTTNPRQFFNFGTNQKIQF